MILAVNPLLVAKAALFVKDHWKPIAVGVFSLILLILMIPTILFSLFVPATEETKAQDYIAISNSAGLDWMNLLVFDTVRYENDFTKADPNDTVFEFISVSYEKLKESCSKYETEQVGKKKVKTCVEWETVVISSKSLDSRNSIIRQLSTIGYHPNPSSFVSVMEQLRLADSQPEYNFTVHIRSLEEVMNKNNFTQDQKEWALTILDSQVLYDLYGGFAGVPGEYEAPDIEGSNGWGWITTSIRITDPFGTRSGNHKGIDIGAVSPGVNGESIFAMTDGVIITSRYSNTAGNFIVIDHGNGIKSRYLHLMRVGLPVGTVVRKGQAIAQMGNSGLSFGTHLHFEILVNGKPVNPLAYFPSIR